MKTSLKLIASCLLVLASLGFDLGLTQDGRRLQIQRPFNNTPGLTGSDTVFSIDVIREEQGSTPATLRLVAIKRVFGAQSKLYLQDFSIEGEDLARLGTTQTIGFNADTQAYITLRLEGVAAVRSVGSDEFVIVGVGETTFGPLQDTSVVRLRRQGDNRAELVESFGDGGVVEIQSSSGYQTPRGLSLTADGDIEIVGSELVGLPPLFDVEDDNVPFPFQLLLSNDGTLINYSRLQLDRRDLNLDGALALLPGSQDNAHPILVGYTSARDAGTTDTDLQEPRPAKDRPIQLAAIESVNRDESYVMPRVAAWNTTEASEFENSLFKLGLDASFGDAGLTAIDVTSPLRSSFTVNDSFVFIATPIAPKNASWSEVVGVSLVSRTSGKLAASSHLPGSQLFGEPGFGELSVDAVVSLQNDPSESALRKLLLLVSAENGDQRLVYLY